MDKLSPFFDGNTLVHYNNHLKSLIVGNTCGIIKLYNPLDIELEPISIDISENFVDITSHNEDILITLISGNLQLVKSKDQSNKILYRSELPLRSSTYINNGKRILSGGDDASLITVDLTEEKSSTIPLPDQLTSISYNPTAELVSVSISNGDILIYSVVNEVPSLYHTIKSATNLKYNTSLEADVYTSQDELICTKSLWLKNSLITSSSDSITSYSREDWQEILSISTNLKIIDFIIVKNYLIVLCKEFVKVYTNNTFVKTLDLLIDDILLNLSWNNDILYISSNSGTVYKVSLVLEDNQDVGTEQEEETVPNGLFEEFLEDDIIDEDDEEAIDYRKDLTESNPKRHKPSSFTSNEITIQPYSPGSTPWTSDSSNRRYLAMNSVGYSWCVKSSENPYQTITVSFFDRSVQNDYHFSDYHIYDLSSMNEGGILLGASGYNQKNKIDNGIIFYRNHSSEQDSWELKLPLLESEFISALSLTNSDKNDHNNSNALIVVGTNFGYLRFFNIHGVCINIIKTTPVVAIIASSISTIFTINQVNQVLTFSIIDINQDYKFIQQNSLLPILHCTPLIKGLFFNEYNDPCIVCGHDDTLLVLQSWRESCNSKWVPVLNCHHSIINDDTKKNWKCWPLGVYDDKLSCIILKHNNPYPSFPLPLPIEIDIKLPVGGYKNQLDDKTPEENFLQSITMGKLISECEEENEEILEKINQYSTVFDKSLLQMFGESCKESKLNKAFSIAKMIRTDKALVAASKISERMQFITLATKIGKLREQLIQDDE